MCYVCCKEFRGWCKSFTKIETVLTILEAVLLVVFIAFIVFLILHFLACSKLDKNDIITYATTKSDTKFKTKYSKTTEKFSKTIKEYSKTTKKYSKYTGKYHTQTKSKKKSTIECSWTPSVKTTAETHYYEDTVHKTQATQRHLSKAKSTPFAIESDNEFVSNNTSNTEASLLVTSKIIDLEINNEYIVEDFIQSDQTDGEDAEDNYKRNVLALVKLKPPQDVIFGCILTLINKHWTLTAASCIESIEEVDSLDSFVMMENYGSLRKEEIHSVSDVEIHPLYEGANKSYDLAALKSEHSIIPDGGYGFGLPSMLDYLLVTIGERFVMLGYGAFRTIDKGPAGRSLRKVYVYSLPSSHCSGEEARSLRHLSGGAAQAQAPCGADTPCAGALVGRGPPCHYCAGAPLLAGATLLGLMADNRLCGVACEPQSYVNIALLRDWLDPVIDT